MPRRGEMWWVRLDPTLGSEIRRTRPCLVVGSDVVNQRRKTVVVVPLSTASPQAPPLLIPVLCGGKRAVAVIDRIRAVAKERFQQKLGSVSSAELEAVEDGLRQILDLA